MKLRFTRPKTWFVGGAIVGWFAATGAVEARADATCTTLSPGQGNTLQLTDDYDAGSGNTCLVIDSLNSTLDLNGHTIRRTGFGLGAGAAIRCSVAGVQIIDTGSPKGGIEGLWQTGIEDCESIEALEIVNDGINEGIVNDDVGLDELSDSVVSVGQFAVTADLKRRASTITNNYVEALSIGINVTGMNDTGGSGKAAIDRNVIRRSSFRAILIENTGLTKVEDNLMYRRDPSDFPGTSDCVELATGTVHNRLLCDCPGENDEFCEGDEPPMLLTLF